MSTVFDQIHTEASAPQGNIFDAIHAENQRSATNQDPPSAASNFLKYSPVGVVKGLADALRQLGTGHNPLAGQAQENEKLFEKAKESFHSGDYTGAAAHFLNYLIPGGAGMEDAGEDFQKGNVTNGLAKTAGMATTVVAGAKGPQILNAATELPGKIMSAVKADPGLDLIKAYGPRDQRFIDKVPDAAADIKAASGKNSLTNEDVIAAAPAAREANRKVWAAWTDQAKHMGSQASGATILQATKESLATTVDPRSRAEIMNEANRIYGTGPLRVDQLEELLHEKNGELRPFYSKDEATRSAAEAAGARTGRSQALLEAQSGAIRDTLYQMLDPENGGAGPREIQHRYGAISTLEDEAWANRNRVLSEGAGTPAGKLARTGAEILSAPGKIVTGNVEGAVMDIPAAMRGKTDPLIMRAFRNTEAPTQLPMPQRPQVAGYLPAAPLTTAPPADASFVRGAPAMPQPPNPARALPAASTRFQGPVADASEVHAEAAHEPFRTGFSQRALPPGGHPEVDGSIGSQHGDILRTPVLSLRDLMRMKPADIEALQQKILDGFK